ncbi:MAG: nuclear transport factor 2 family protein [Halalkalicoccus sp.]|nr:nuclear transport factor 2 family protein [Halalkalicoccus sp.]
METAAREYYRTIDAHAYDDLAALLDPGFTHYRPDRTIEGRAAFVEFMREDRPMTDTSHGIRTVYEADGGVAVRGRLLDHDGEELFGFVDVFEFSDAGAKGAITAVYTYTR